METPSEPAQHPLDLTEFQTVPLQKGSIGPFCGYVIALLFGDLIGFAIMRVSMDGFFAAAFPSFILGQIALAIVVGGLMADNWLEGLFLSVALVLCGIGLSMFAGGADLDSRVLRGIVIIPFACFVAALPFILLRWTIGWKLRRQELPVPPRMRLTIEDMILVPASVMAICVVASIQDREMFVFLGLASSFILLPIISLLFVLPCTYWAFRVEDSVHRWLLCLGYPLAVVIIVMVCIASFGGQLPGEAVGWGVFCTLTASCVAMLGTQILYASGYRLTGFSHAAAHLPALPEMGEAQSATVDTSPFDIEDPKPIHRPIDNTLTGLIRRRHRVAVGILLVGTVILNAGLSAYTQIELRQWLKQIVANGGTVEMDNGKPSRIAFGPTTTDGTLLRMPSMPSVKSISFAGTGVQSLYLGNKFASLESIDIRETTINPQYMSAGDRSIEILVREGQFSDAEIKNLASRGYTVKPIPD
jgi:hypothetical protein